MVIDGARKLARGDLGRGSLFVEHGTDKLEKLTLCTSHCIQLLRFNAQHCLAMIGEELLPVTLR